MSQQKSSWDFGRFFKTLTYFEVFPWISCLQRLFWNGTQNSQETVMKDKILLVGVSEELQQQLIHNLSHYDIGRYNGKLTDGTRLATALMQDITTIIVNLEDYESEYEFDHLLELTSQYLKSSSEKLLFDFAHSSDTLKSTWGAVDDVVMGGVSESSIRLIDNRAIFAGNVSTDNSGGFASVRTRNFSPAWDLSHYEGIELCLKGDGKRYKFITRCEGKWDGLAYCYSFDTVEQTWITLQIPFRELRPVFRAKTVQDAEAFDNETVYSMQLMLSKFEYDGALNPNFEPGGFCLEIESIKGYTQKSRPPLIVIGKTTDNTRLKQSSINAVTISSDSTSEIVSRCLQLLS